MPNPAQTKNDPKGNKDRVVGIVLHEDGNLRVKPCDKKKRNLRFDISAEEAKKLQAGDIVVMENPRLPPQKTDVTRILGHKTSPGILSLVSLYEKGLKEEFSKAAVKEAESMTVPGLQGREDLRALPLVTIDGADARDFDDAVFAEKTQDGGFHLIVAIADVSWYVHPGSALDKDALERGNSTYFPDRVLPMLPESLSNGLCSLKPKEDRACMAFHLYIDKDGNMTRYSVTRALMNSAARLTYEQAQKAKDGQPDAVTAPLMDTVINPIYEAYEALKKAREKRGALDLGSNDVKIAVDAKGKATGVEKPSRLDSHKVIEEFAVLTNVAAAKTLESKKAPCVYRIHGTPPSLSKIEELRALLSGFGITLPAEIKHASDFKEALKKAAALPEGRQLVNAIARIQAKAVYDTNNIGHFGLALENYAHFTSPIRRYADLLVHRSLVEAFNMGPGAINKEQKENLRDMAIHISETESLSSKAERSARDRFSVAALSSKIGQELTGRIATVTNAGLFIKLNRAGADGLLPMKKLPKDYYDLDKKNRTLTGRAHGRVYQAGMEVTVRLKEVDGLLTEILLEPANDNFAKKMLAPSKKPAGPKFN